MNESKWLTGADGDAMLEFVADRLSGRQWVFLAAAYVRKLWDLLPQGVLQQAVDHAERVIGLPDAGQRAEWSSWIEAAVPTAVGSAEALQREIVRSCDPDAAEVEQPILTRANQSAPAFPLFQAASRYAAEAIGEIGTALAEAAQAIRDLYAEPGEENFLRIRDHIERAAEIRTQANRAANNALRMKHEGDELADEAAGAKNKRLFESRAVERVRKMEEGVRQRLEGGDFEAQEKRDRAARKQLALFLREVVGNPFKPPRFEAAWRTSTVVQLAQGIFDERAFDRMPILADALLDADCDEEAVLRHCRGTEVWSKEPVYHIRGCWVIELILGRYEPLPAPKPGKPAKARRKRGFEDFDLGLPFDLGGDRMA